MRRISHSALVGVALASTIPATALRAQFPADVRVGSRVRVWLPEPHRQSEGPPNRQMLRGTVAGVSRDTLELTIPGAIGSVSIPRATIRRMQLSRGASRAGSAVEGAFAAAAATSIQWALLNDPRRRGGPNFRTDWQAAGVGAAWGAGIGAVVGLVFPHEQWRRVRLRK